MLKNILSSYAHKPVLYIVLVHIYYFWLFVSYLMSLIDSSLDCGVLMYFLMSNWQLHRSRKSRYLDLRDIRFLVGKEWVDGLSSQLFIVLMDDIIRCLEFIVWYWSVDIYLFGFRSRFARLGMMCVIVVEDWFVRAV